MYIGDVGPKGLHHLVYEVVDNSLMRFWQVIAHIDCFINENNSITVSCVEFLLAARKKRDVQH